MGYHVSIDLYDLVIPQEHEHACLAAINALMTTWYSWIDQPPTPDGYASLVEACVAWRYEAFTTESGDTEIGAFMGDKWGDDEVLYRAIAPFVTTTGDPTITIEGGDGESWRYRFSGGGILEERGVIQWVPA